MKKNILFIIKLVFLLVTVHLSVYSQKDITNVLSYFLPKQIDSYQDKLLFLGYDWENGGILSVYIKSVNENSIVNITENVNLNLDVHQKIHFDNYGNIWAFGKSNLWKYTNEQWVDVPAPPDLLPNRQFRDFCFDNENNLFVGVKIGFEKYRETINGTVYVVYDSVNNELLKINTNTPTVSYEVIKKFNDKAEHFYDAIHAIRKRPDGAIACILAEEINNLMIYKNGELSYQTIPVSPDGLSAIVTSMEYDNQMNLWYSVKAAGQFYNESPFNGVHKFSSTGIHTSWDSSDGLKGQLFREDRFEPTLSVHDISINKNTGVIWGVTSFGFFSIDESKSKNNQLAFYSRDSLVNQKFRFFPTNASVTGNEFLFESITVHNQNTYMVSQLGYLEVKNETISSVDTKRMNPELFIDVKSTFSNNKTLIVTINSNTHLNGSVLNVVDLSGALIKSISIESATGEIEIPIEIIDLPSGSYFVVLKSGNTMISKQFFLTK